MRPLWYCALFVLAVLGCQGEQSIKTATEMPKPAGSPDVAKEHIETPKSRQGGTPAGQSGAAAGAVELGGIKLTPRADWARKPSGSSFVAAEFSLPRAGDGADGRLTLSTAGGTVEANIDRWKGQFQPQPTSAKEEVLDVDGLKVTIVDFSGDFNDQRGPFAPGEKRTGYRMIAAVIPVDNQLYFVKATGPEKTIESQAGAIREFIRSARRTK